VKAPQDAKRMIEYTRCAGIMIGRGALSTPWLFRDTHSFLTTGTVAPKPSIDEIVQLMRDHFYHMCKFRNEHAATIEFRKRISWYARNLVPCTRLREEMRLVTNANDFEGILSRFLDWRREREAQRNIQTDQVEEIEPALTAAE
jgi:tRNA-dihydrouridine synthase B